MTFEPIPEADDRVPGRPIATVVLATILAIAACAGVVWITTASGGGASRVETADRIPPSAPFSFETTPEAVRAAQRAEIDRWIDGAIDRYLEARR